MGKHARQAAAVLLTQPPPSESEHSACIGTGMHQPCVEAACPPHTTKHDTHRQWLAPAAVHIAKSRQSFPRRHSSLTYAVAVLLVHNPVCAHGAPLPGSRPPAQLHGSLDEGLDESEQQEIQKIISEIHGKTHTHAVRPSESDTHSAFGLPCSSRQAWGGCRAHLAGTAGLSTQQQE